MFDKWFNKTKNASKSQEIGDKLIEKCSVYYISCDAIRANAMRSRYDFDEDKLVDLAYSIKRYGVIEPIIVRETDIDDSYDYEIVSGERRLRAARLAGLNLIPSIIIDVTQEISAEMSLTENLQSEPLNYFESAVALQRLKDIYGDEFANIATRLTVSQSELDKKLGLLELNYNERQILLNMNVSEKNALGIAQISDASQRHRIIESICGEGLSENAIEERISELSAFDSKSGINPELPRDLSTAIKGIVSRVEFLNRRKKRAEIKLLQSKSHITATIRIKL